MINKFLLFLEAATSEQDFETKMNDLTNRFFDSLTNILKTFFSSIGGVISLIGGLAALACIVFALVDKERRKNMLFAAAGCFVIVLIGIVVYKVFGS
ncbi:MAG: hypothetical protein ACK5NF_04105 [Bacilli bacterium]